MTTPAGPPSRSEHERSRIAHIESMRGEGVAAVPSLLAEFVEPSWAVRRAATEVLASGDRNVALALCQALRTERGDEAKIAGIVDALSASKEDVDQTLLELTRDQNPAVVCDAVQILGRHESAHALPRLEELTRQADDNVALAAVEALGRVGSKAAIDSLLQLIATRNFFRTFPAIDVLGRARDPRVLPALIELAAEPLYAAEAVRALGRLADPGAVAPLVELLATANEGLVRNLALALVAIREQSKRQFGTGAAVERVLAVSEKQPALRRQLAQSVKRADPTEQLAIGQVLAWIGDESTVPTLLALLDGPGAVAQVAAASLKQLVGIAEPQLLEALEHGPAARRRLVIPIV
ncbi:MAG TPA: HEAT repeat domain-containing protein, partial [Polyangiaceae bacterium]